MSTNSSDIDQSLTETLEALAAASPAGVPGLILLGGELRRVYFPALGKQRVVWRKAYCLSKAEAIGGGPISPRRAGYICSGRTPDANS